MVGGQTMLNDLFVIRQTCVAVKTSRFLSPVFSILDAVGESPFFVSKEADYIGGDFKYSE